MKLAASDTAATYLASRAPDASKRRAAEEAALKQKANASQTAQTKQVARPADAVELSAEASTKVSAKSDLRTSNPPAPISLPEPLPGFAQTLQTPAQDPRKGAISDTAPATVEVKPQAKDTNPLAPLLNAYGARAGDERFDPSLDHNGDGVIDFADLNAALNSATPTTTPETTADTPASIDNAPVGQPGSPTSTSAGQPDDGRTPEATQPDHETPITPPQDDTAEPSLEDLLANFGLTSADENYRSEFDFDQDGTINFADLNELLNRIAKRSDQTAAQQALVEQLTSIFGSREGEKTFNANLDLNGDGTITFADLNRLLNNLAEQHNASQQS